MTGGDFVLSGGGRHCGNSGRLDIRRRAGRRRARGFLRGAARLWLKHARREGRGVSEGLKITTPGVGSKRLDLRRRSEGEVLRVVAQAP